MGSQKSTITALTLNYSGIYLSPFQFYGFDNWKELQKVGRIFQEELKKCYHEIKHQTQELGKSFPDKQYKRESFKWEIGDIDKKIHVERYTPIYTSTDKIINQDFAGIGRKNNKQFFLSQEEFQQQWDQVFDKLPDQDKTTKEVKDAVHKASRLNRYHCSMLDFLCFKSIVLFVNYQEPNADKCLDFKEDVLWDFSKLAEKSKQDDMSKVVGRYKEFMAKYYSIISIKGKINLTKQWMFQKNKPETVSFTQATPQFRHHIEKISGYHLLGPSNPKKVKQTIIMVKDSLPFIPANFDAQNQRLKKMGAQKQDIFKKLGSNADQLAQNLPELQNFIKENIQKDPKEKMLSMCEQLRQNPEAMKQRIGRMIDQSIDPIKAELQQVLNRHINSFDQFYQNQLKDQYKKGSKQQKDASQYMTKLKRENCFIWNQDIIFKEFTSSKVILGAFHLSSKPLVGKLQAQLMGLVIYHLAQTKGYKFIFSGDFNSYLTLSQKDEYFCVFQFLKKVLRQQGVPQQKLNNFLKTVNIFPKHPRILTTKKKRTILQAQMDKTNELAEKCVDQICSNFQIDYNSSHSGEIKDIGKSKNNFCSFIPHKDHPYDHFVVEATLNFEQTNP